MSDDMVAANNNGQMAPTNLSGAAFATDDMFDQLVRSSFLARLQLCSGSSDIVKEGKMGVGKFSFTRNKDDFVDLGDSVNFQPLSWRFAALRFGPPVESYYDPSSPEFKAIQAQAGEQDSGCSYGPQFLVWVPAVKDFGIFMFGSASARPEARKLKQLLDQGKAATIKARLVSNNKNKWHVPVILPCSVELDPYNPDTAQVIAQKFNNPEAGVEFEPVQQGGTPAEQPAVAGSERVV